MPAPQCSILQARYFEGVSILKIWHDLQYIWWSYGYK